MNRLTATLFLFLVGWLPTVTVLADDIYVSPMGDDRADGTAQHPLRTPQQALRQAREWRRTNNLAVRGGIRIVLKAGRYYMEEPLLIRSEDSGTPESWTTILSEQPGDAVLCGDARQEHWQLYPATGMERMIDFDKTNRTIIIPRKAVEGLEISTEGAATQPQQPLLSADGRQLEMVIHQRWAIAILRVKDIRVEGDRAIVSFMEPESRLEFEHPWPQPVIGGEKGNSSFLLRETERRDGIERLVIVDGTPEDPILCVAFEGLAFENTCWNRPQHLGHVTLQGGFPLLDAYRLKQEGLPWDATLENQAWVERPVAAVTINGARQVNVQRCRFSHLGATALDYGVGVSDCTIAGNTFTDIGGSAILAGSFAESPREVHRPYQHLAAGCSGLKISDNTIDCATVEDWGCVGIGCGYVRDVSISRNTVCHVNYSGICVGWGWTAADTGMSGNVIRQNTVSDFALQLYDAGGIYTLSNQPGSSIVDNTITRLGDAPYATNDRGFYIYLDARTDGYTIDRNRCDAVKFGDNQPGPAIRWGKNGPK